MVYPEKYPVLEINPVHGAMGIEVRRNEDLGRPDGFPVNKLKHLLSDREAAWPDYHKDGGYRVKQGEECTLPPIDPNRQYDGSDIGNEFKGAVFIDEETRARFVWPEPVDTRELEKERMKRGCFPSREPPKKRRKEKHAKKNSASPEESTESTESRHSTHSTESTESTEFTELTELVEDENADLED